MVLSGYSYIFMIHSVLITTKNRAIASLIYINERFLNVYSFLIKTMFRTFLLIIVCNYFSNF